MGVWRNLIFRFRSRFRFSSEHCTMTIMYSCDLPTNIFQKFHVCFYQLGHSWSTTTRRNSPAGKRCWYRTNLWSPCLVCIMWHGRLSRSMAPRGEFRCAAMLPFYGMLCVCFWANHSGRFQTQIEEENIKSSDSWSALKKNPWVLTPCRCTPTPGAPGPPEANWRPRQFASICSHPLPWSWSVWFVVCEVPPPFSRSYGLNAQGASLPPPGCPELDAGCCLGFVRNYSSSLSVAFKFNWIK